MPYPSVISALSTPQPTDRLNSPSHSSLHQSENTAIIEIQTFVGTLSSVPGTIIYDVRSPLSGGGGHVQTAALGGTGQTTFNKGDVLVASSSSVLTKLGVGADGALFTADSTTATGAKWALSPGVNVQSVFATGLWTKPTGATATSKVLVELWGAGGSGGGSAATTEAGGGGGGAYVAGFFPASILSASVLVGIGLGGAGVNQTSNGLTGTATVFDVISSLLTAYPGGGGGGNGGSGSNGGGGGGVAGAGGSSTGSPGGGGSVFGGIGGDTTGTAGIAGTYIGLGGGGGGGGGVVNNGTGASGGAALWGGGGGAGVGATGVGAGGISNVGANGGNSSILVNASIAQASFAGGGGAAYGSGSTSGPGGNGRAIITTFL